MNEQASESNQPLIPKEKKKRAKRMTKSEEEKRAQILEPLLNQWAYLRDPYTNEISFIKHALMNENKYSRIIQIILSDYPEQNGIYEIKDYEIGNVFDISTSQKKVEIKIKEYDLTYGLFSDGVAASNSNELIAKLMELDYLTKEEYDRIKKDGKFYQECPEILLSFYRHNRKRKEL